MEVKLNIPDWLKIPLKIVIPTAFIASGCLVMLPKDILSLLYLLEWRDNYGFYIGLLFLISASLIVVYFLYYLKVGFCILWNKFFAKRQTIKRIMEMNVAEQTVIFGLYHSDSYTAKLDYNQPIVKGLLFRGYIYTGSDQMVTTDPYTNRVPINCTLQPSVYQALTYSERKLQKRMQKLSNRIQRVKDTQKKERLQRKYDDLKDNYNNFYCEENIQWTS